MFLEFYVLMQKMVLWKFMLWMVPTNNVFDPTIAIYIVYTISFLKMFILYGVQFMALKLSRGPLWFLCLNFGSKFLAIHVIERGSHRRIAIDFACVYCTVAGIIFGITDVYKLGFSYLSISIFNRYNLANCSDLILMLVSTFMSMESS